MKLTMHVKLVDCPVLDQWLSDWAKPYSHLRSFENFPSPSHSPEPTTSECLQVRPRLQAHMLGACMPCACNRSGRRGCPAHQDLSQLFFLAFPWLLPIHLSGFLPGPERAEKNISLLHLRSKYVSTFPFPFFFFLQSSCNRATNSESLPFSVY